MTAGVLIGAFVLAFSRSRDPFHPLLIMVPMLGTLYVYLPLSGLQDGQVFRYLAPEQMSYTQLLFLLGSTAFCIGCLIATHKRPKQSALFRLPETVRLRLMIGACLLGFAAFAAWITTLFNAGGFTAAYSKAYGVGTSEYGYVRDAVYWSLPALVLLITARLGQRLRIRDAILIFLFMAPLGVHGLLGARRGPVFMAAVSIGLSWYMMRYRRPRLVLMLSGGVALGLLMLFLVSNRDNIYLGSEWKLENSPNRYLKMSTGNEFIYGSAAVLHADRYDRFFWGRRYIAILFIRPIPVQVWPNKYDAVGMGDLKQNLGIGSKEFRSSVGWAGAGGAAPGLISDLYIEAHWFYVLPLLVIGWAYGKVWWLATHRGGFSIVLYVLMAALSVFLVMQTLEAMLVRVLWMGLPSFAVWKWALRTDITTAGQRVFLMPGRAAKQALTTVDKISAEGLQ